MVGVTLGVAVGVGVLPGCKPCFSPLTPEPPTLQKKGARTITVRATIKPGKYRELRALLDDECYDPFAQPTRGIHYARLFTTDESSLFFMVIYDDFEQALAFLHDNADGVDPIFSLCVDYPDAGARDYEALERFVWNKKICVQLFYRAYNTTQPKVREALTLRARFLEFVRRSDGVTAAELSQLYANFRDDPHLFALAPDKRRKPRPGSLELASDDPLKMERIVGTGRVNPFTLLARVRDDKLKQVKRILQLGTFATIDLGLRPLSNLPTLHFARVSIIDDNRLLFASVYDGDFIQYVEDFGTRIASEIDKVFGACVGYPLAGSRDVGQFRTFLRSHQIATSAFGGSYLNHTLLEIQASLALSKALARFGDRISADDPNLRGKLDRFLYDNQLLLS